MTRKELEAKAKSLGIWISKRERKPLTTDHAVQAANEILEFARTRTYISLSLEVEFSDYDNCVEDIYVEAYRTKTDEELLEEIKFAEIKLAEETSQRKEMYEKLKKEFGGM